MGSSPLLHSIIKLLECNQVSSGNLDTSTQVLLIYALYCDHKINQIKAAVPWELHEEVSDIIF